MTDTDREVPLTRDDAPWRGAAARPEALVLVSRSLEETAVLGRRIAAQLGPGDTVLLSGELGAGKTALTKAIAAGLDVTEEVSSPTFTLVNEYRGRLPVFHLDLYRLEDAAEVLDLGFNDYLTAGGVTIVEWADKAPELWPDDYLALTLDRIGETDRRLTITAAGRLNMLRQLDTQGD